MPRLRGLSTLVIVLGLCLSLARVYAASPSIVMIYGPSLPKPVFVTMTNGQDAQKYLFLTCGGVGNLPRGIEARPFVKVAAFWEHRLWSRYLADPKLLPELVPALSSQHGRLYLPTGTEPAFLVSTQFLNTKPVPIPEEPTAFELRCSLSGANTAVLRELGVPGF
jgi:hypothetical protein